MRTIRLHTSIGCLIAGIFYGLSAYANGLPDFPKYEPTTGIAVQDLLHWKISWLKEVIKHRKAEIDSKTLILKEPNLDESDKARIKGEIRDLEHQNNEDAAAISELSTPGAFTPPNPRAAANTELLKQTVAAGIAKWKAIEDSATRRLQEAHDIQDQKEREKREKEEEKIRADATKQRTRLERDLAKVL